MALTNNLDLQIDRYNPQIALYNLRSAYGPYDPSFSLSGQHDHNETSSQYLGGGLSLPGSVSDDNTFNSTLSGLLPWGTTYSLGTGKSITDTYGSSGTTVNDLTRPLFYTTNTIVLLTNGTPQTVASLTTNYAQVPGRSPFENSSASVSLTASQPLLKNFLIDSTRLTIRLDKNQLKTSELLLKQQIMQTATALEQAYYHLIYLRENVVVQEKAVELAERLVAENKKKLEVGSLAPLDLASAEAQAAQSRAAVLAAQAQLGTQERLVKQYITDKFSEWADITLEPSGNFTADRQFLNRQDSWSKGLAQRPELLQAKLSLQSAGIQLKYARNQLLPELDVFATYGFNGAGTEFSDALYNVQQMNLPYYTYGGKITIPLGNISARNAYKSSKMTLQQAVLTVKKWERDIMIAIDNDIGTLMSNYDQVNATRAQREYEEAALDAEQKKLENGKSTTYTVLQVQRDLTTARGAEIQALDSYDETISQLSYDEGSTLERLGIDLERK
jgi:outer membrane protein TolC